MKLRRAVLALVLAAVLPATAAAQLYRWTDDDGNVHYADSPEGIPERFREGTNRVRPDRIDGVPVAPAPPPALPVAPTAGSRRDVLVASAGALYAMTTHTRIHDIAGRSAAELETALSRRRLGAHDGKTTSSYRWRYRTTPLGATCVVAYVELEMVVSIDLPGWSPTPEASGGVAEQWDRYFTALRLHEEGHRQLAVSEGHEVLEAIMAVNGPCAAMDDAVQAAVAAVAARYRERHVQYDAQTQHGVVQGAVFRSD